MVGYTSTQVTLVVSIFELKFPIWLPRAVFTGFFSLYLNLSNSKSGMGVYLDPYKLNALSIFPKKESK